MAGEKPEGCVASAAGPMKPKVEGKPEQIGSQGQLGKESAMSVMVGKEAPDFEAAAHFEGGFKMFKLSEFRGKWVFLCFYPGDFTFV